MEPDAEHEYQAIYDLNVSYHDNAQSVATRVTNGNKITYSFNRAANLNMTPIFSQKMHSSTRSKATLENMRCVVAPSSTTQRSWRMTATATCNSTSLRHRRASSERYHFHVVHEPHQHQHYRFGFGTPSEVISLRRRKSM